MSDQPEKLNRDAWLNRMAELLRLWFRENGYTIHGRIVVSMAALKWRGKRSLLGICHYDMDRKEKDVNYVFVTAFEYQNHSDPVNVAATLVHELLHAVLPPGAKHGALFKDGCKALGLDGKATTTHAGPRLREHLTKLVASLPPLPKMGVLAPPPPPKPKKDPQAPFKFQCDTCKTTLFIRFTSLERAGTPRCWNPECDAENEPMDEKE
jgi:hypothetical protein